MNCLKIFAVFLMILVSISCACAKDYYVGKTSLKGRQNEYAIKYSDAGSYVHIYNKANSKTKFNRYPYLQDTNEVLVHPVDVDFDKVELGNILKSVFSNRKIDRYYRCGDCIILHLIISPKTKRAIELAQITLSGQSEKHTSILYAIPIKKIEKLERLIKERLTFYVPKEFQTANYLNNFIYLFSRKNEKLVN